MGAIEEIKTSRRKRMGYFEDNMRKYGYHFEDSEPAVDIVDLFPPPMGGPGG